MEKFNNRHFSNQEESDPRSPETCSEELSPNLRIPISPESLEEAVRLSHDAANASRSLLTSEESKTASDESEAQTPAELTDVEDIVDIRHQADMTFRFRTIGPAIRPRDPF